MEDDGESLPEPTAISDVKADSTADIVTLVDVDFGESVPLELPTIAF